MNVIVLPTFFPKILDLSHFDLSINRGHAFRSIFFLKLFLPCVELSNLFKETVSLYKTFSLSDFFGIPQVFRVISFHYIISSLKELYKL